MTTSHPLHTVPALPERRAKPRAKTLPLPPATSSCHYHPLRRSRKVVVFAVLASAGLHAFFLLGFQHAKKKAAPIAVEYVLPAAMVMPDVKELEDPEPVPVEDTGDTADLSLSVPMQVDLPRPIQLGDFVQQLDFSTFIERPTDNQNRMWTIPEGRHGGKIGEHMGDIFNLADLERAPEPVLQPAPVYPGNMRREAVNGTVLVEFIVDTQGRVVNAFAVDTTHFGFNAAAIAGVEKWKFRPGIRGGRKVNTRIRIPIVFSVVDATN